MSTEPTYRIVRFFRTLQATKVIATGLDKTDAVAHCMRPDTSTDEWFDGWTVDPEPWADES